MCVRVFVCAHVYVSVCEGVRCLGCAYALLHICVCVCVNTHPVLEVCLCRRVRIQMQQKQQQQQKTVCVQAGQENFAKLSAVFARACQRKERKEEEAGKTGP